MPLRKLFQFKRRDVVLPSLPDLEAECSRIQVEVNTIKARGTLSETDRGYLIKLHDRLADLKRALTIPVKSSKP